MTWRPNLQGWSDDILPFYERMAGELPDGAVIVEVGVAWFRSAIYLASQFVEKKKKATIWCVDTWEDNYCMRNGKPAWFAEAIRSLLANANDSEIGLLRPLRMASVLASKSFEPAFVDMVFIDGEHDYQSVKADIEAWAPKVKPRGILCGHDYTQAHREVREAVDQHIDKIRVMDGSLKGLRVTESVWEISLS